MAGISDGDGAIGRGSGRPDGDVGEMPRSPRALYGQGTPREAAETLYALIIVLRAEAALVFVLIATSTANSP